MHAWYMEAGTHITNGSNKEQLLGGLHQLPMRKLPKNDCSNCCGCYRDEGRNIHSQGWNRLCDTHYFHSQYAVLRCAEQSRGQQQTTTNAPYCMRDPDA